MRVEFANTLRGIAALSVVVSHYFGVFWLNRETVATVINADVLSTAALATPSYINWINSFSLLNWGAYGVALFFIISGFVIPFSLQNLSAAAFALNRLFRILPVYAVGFTLTLVALWVSAKVFDKPWPYSWKEIGVHYLPGVRDVLWSRNIDGIIWTLEIEVKFYLICAAAVSWFRAYSHKVFYIPVALFVGAYWLKDVLPSPAQDLPLYRAGLNYMFVSQYLLYMFIGAAFHYLYMRKMRPEQAYLLVALFFLLFMVQWKSGPYHESFSAAWSYGFAVLTFAFAFTYPRLFKATRVANFLANVSYPMYVIHGLAGYVVMRLLAGAGANAECTLLLVVALCMFFSWALHVTIELPAQRLGKRISRASVKVPGNRLEPVP